MAVEFRLPDVGEGIHEAVLVKWRVKPGDTVKADEPFCDVETDKAVVELPSPVAGTVSKLNFAPGDVVHVGDAMIVFDADDDTVSKPARPASVSPESSPAPATRMTSQPSSAPASVPHSPPVQAAPDASAEPPARRPLATPHTRALARKLGVDLAAVAASGKGGRITDEDVRKTASRLLQDTAEALSAAAEPVPVIESMPLVTHEAGERLPETAERQSTDFGPVERIRISRLRQLIARNMRASKATLAHVTHVDEADVTDLDAMYRKVKQQVADMQNVKFTIMPFFVKSAVAALKKYPVLNASFDEDNQEMIIKHYYHVGFAADTPEGLVVPVIRDADRKDMIRIAQEIADKAERARERKITLDELQGAGFTITNVGPLGGLFATPVIPLPQLAILGMHAMKDRPVVRNGQIVIRKMMNLSISFDHRMIDGMTAAAFLHEVISLIESPEMLMLRLV
ncbi:2-oxo acid dehydrogenase subunit E2 [bacterium]|nr:2-oxo acid dehydrogenase subunit E2 [candidate division CSSED10-310 bacterium]